MMREKGQRLMAHGYAAFLRTIIDNKGAATWETMVEIHYGAQARARLSAQQVLAEMTTCGLAHVSGWVPLKAAKRQILTPTFAYGPGENAPHPGFQSGKKKKPWKHRVPRAELIGLKTAIDLMREDDYHGSKLAQEMGIGTAAARKLIRALHDAKLAHVADWQRRENGGVQCALYAYGLNQKDMPRPPRVATPREHWAKYNQARASRRRAMHALGMTKTVRRVSIRDLGFVHKMEAVSA